jgi:integrase
MGVGPYPEVSLAEAREAAAAARRLLREGEDPIEARRRGAKLKHQRKSFREACDAWLESHKAGWGEEHTGAVRYTLNEASDVIGDMAVADVTAADVLRVLQPIWETKNVTAVNLRGRIENVLSYAGTMGWRTGPNPASWRGSMADLLPKPSRVHETKHFAALPWEGVPEFMATLASEDRISALALRFCILTAARSAMVLGATWAEIDLEHRLWTVPKERMKGKRDCAPNSAHRSLAPPWPCWKRLRTWEKDRIVPCSPARTVAGSWTSL